MNSPFIRPFCGVRKQESSAVAVRALTLVVGMICGLASPGFADRSSGDYSMTQEFFDGGGSVVGSANYRVSGVSVDQSTTCLHSHDYVVYPVPGPWLGLARASVSLTITRTDGGRVELSAATTFGSGFRLQETQDLEAGVWLEEATAPRPGTTAETTVWELPIRATQRARFYRLVSVSDEDPQF